MNTMDLFENLDFVPATVAKVINKNLPDEGANYEQLYETKKQLNELGYTFDFGLDAVPFNLRKLRNHLNQ